VPLLIAVPFGPLLAWKRGDLLGAAQRLIGAGIALALVAIAVVLGMDRGGRCWRRSRSGLRLRHRRRAERSRRAHRIVPRAVCNGDARARAACRARPGARRSRISASACADRDRLRDHLERANISALDEAGRVVSIAATI
jgi:hypothetical protein